MNTPKVSLDQWRAFQTVVDEGGFAQAAVKLHRSQSSVSYAVNRLQELLGIPLLRIQGRKAVLTEAGTTLLQRSRQLLCDAGNIEQLAEHLNQGWESVVRLAVEAAFPAELVMSALKTFGTTNQSTQVHLQEAVLSGAEDILLNGDADLVISPYVPQGFLGEALIQVDFVAVAHPQHPLHCYSHVLTAEDLKRETQIVVSDSGSKSIDAGWLSDSRRWTVASMDTSLKLIRRGLGFGWLPRSEIQQQLNTNELKPLPLVQGQVHKSQLYLIFAEMQQPGPATQQLADILRKVCAQA